ncbi:hypothetical protein SK128_017348 [Halocaridina rubra]|uniref:cellulase n=1 Tax=Halocaridina rubra TaxID=373956 RepID=A0AAN8XQA8_HALRR
MKEIPRGVLWVFVLATTLPNAMAECKRTYDYDDVLHKSLLFFEAQRSGVLPASQRVKWRKDSASNDAPDADTKKQVDLAGGYYDAGDYAKFGFPMAATTTLLAWGAIDYGEAYTAANEMVHLREAVKWATDYFIKAHPEANVFYGQVGLGTQDNNYWGRPEDMKMTRPAYKITATKSGSDLAGETAAALAATAIISEFSWDEKTPGVHVLMAQLQPTNQTYLNNAKKYCDKIIDATEKTPKGLVFILKWGSLRYAANAAFLILRAADSYSSQDKAKAKKYQDFAKKQIHYMLGDGGRSYVVGYGCNPPVRPHHPSSSCPSSPAKCDWDTYDQLSSEPNIYELAGALVGGPDSNDNYSDTRENVEQNEVTTDYNAGFQSAVAALRVLAKTGSVTSNRKITTSCETNPKLAAIASNTTRSQDSTTPSVKVHEAFQGNYSYKLKLTLTFSKNVSSWNMDLQFSYDVTNIQVSFSLWTKKS